MSDFFHRLYWYFHGPVGNPQPHQMGYSAMSGSAVIWFLVSEAVLGICILLAFWGIDWLGAGGTLNKLLKALVAVVLGGLMLVKLFAFAG